MKQLLLEDLDEKFVKLDMKHFLGLDWVHDYFLRAYNESDRSEVINRIKGFTMARIDNKSQWTYITFFNDFSAASSGMSTHRKVTSFIHGEIQDKMPLKMQFIGNTHDVYKTGWDPEMFVEDEKGELIPAFSFLPNKQTPIPTGYGGAYYDGFQAEFTTTPDNCHGYGFDYLRGGLLTILRQAQKKFPKAHLSLKSVYRIPDKLLQESSEEQVALGCKPSLNAYGQEAFRVEASRSLPFRVSGGHIHFSFLPVKPDTILNRIKAMDLFLALPCVGIFDGVDDPLRREFYGRAGEYRTPAYGLEYRTLSNAWLCDPKLGHGIMDVARKACGVGKIPNLFKEVGVDEAQVQEIINFCDVKNARKVATKFWPIFEAAMGPKWQPQTSKAYKELVMEGVGAGFPEYQNIEKNWCFDTKWDTHSNHLVNCFNTHCSQAKYNVA
jgi:hypothetical protein